MSTRDKLKELFRSLIRQEMEEASVTGNLDGGAGPPKTPYMFQSKPKSKIHFVSRPVPEASSKTGPLALRATVLSSSISKLLSL